VWQPWYVSLLMGVGLTLCLEKMIYLRLVFLSREELIAEIDVIHFCGSWVVIEVRTVQTSDLFFLLLRNQTMHTR
jgi:hypothetical protein